MPACGRIFTAKHAHETTGVSKFSVPTVTQALIATYKIPQAKSHLHPFFGRDTPVTRM